jgi:hypothetical protein
MFQIAIESKKKYQLPSKYINDIVKHGLIWSY